MKLPRHAKIFRGQLDVAPFVSVVFLLLMFLLLHSRLVYTPGVRIDLAELPDALPGTTNPVAVVSVDASGRMYFESQHILADALEARLEGVVRENGPKLTLILQAHKKAELDQIVRLSNLARRAGVTTIWIATRPRMLVETNSAAGL